MAGINIGILNNGIPLTTAQIKDLETRILNDGENGYAYLDEESKLCFAMPHNADIIRELAWHNAYELSKADGILTKKAYKKSGVSSFYLDKIFTKANINTTWSEVPAEIFRFDADLEGRPHQQLVEGVLLVKVSDKFFDEESLSGQTLTLKSLDSNGNFTSSTVDLDNCEIVVEESVDFCGLTVGIGDALFMASLNSPLPDAMLDAGTYFVVYSEDGYYSFTSYVESLSILTSRDALVPVKTPTEDVFSFYEFLTTADPDSLSIIELGGDACYVKVTDRVFSKEDILYSKLRINTEPSFDIELSGMVRQEHFVSGLPEVPISAVSCDPCFEKVGADQSDSVIAVLMVHEDTDLEGAIVTKGTYFLFADSEFDDTVFTESISCLTKADALQSTI